MQNVTYFTKKSLLSIQVGLNDSQNRLFFMRIWAFKYFLERKIKFEQK